MRKQTIPSVNEISISYKPMTVAEHPKKVINSNDAFKLLFPFYDEDTIFVQEQFIVLYLNVRNKVIGVYPISRGGITGTVVDIRLIFSVALKTAASSIILSHNHPSGFLKPSDVDMELTKKITSAARFIDIKVLDHLILSGERQYFSFADVGLI